MSVWEGLSDYRQSEKANGNFWTCRAVSYPVSMAAEILFELNRTGIRPYWRIDLRENGRIEAVIRGLAIPNGIVFSPDETRLYVADTGGDKRSPDAKTHDLAPGIHCFEVNTDGSLGKKIFRTNKGGDGWLSMFKAIFIRHRWRIMKGGGE